MKNNLERLAFALLGLPLLASSLGWSRNHWQPKASPSTSAGAPMNASERHAAEELFLQANQDRAAHRLPGLNQDPALTLAAWRHAQRMVRAGILSHDFPGEPDLTVRVQAAGVRCSTVDENLAEAPTADTINNEWMHSPPHRANLLDPRVNAVGIAVIKVHGELYAVQDFARVVPSLTTTQREQQVASLLARRGLQVLPGSAMARSYCGNSPNRKRPLPRLMMKYSTSDLTRLPQQITQRMRSGTYRRAEVGACRETKQNGFTAYQMVILLY